MSKIVLHFKTESPAFGGAMCWDTLCGAELWNLGFDMKLVEDEKKVNCEKCLRILKRRNK